MVPKVTSVLRVGDIELLGQPGQFNAHMSLINKNLVRVTVSHVGGRVRKETPDIFDSLLVSSLFDVFHLPCNSQPMLCHARHTARSVILPDFLLPGLSHRAASSSISRTTREAKQFEKFAVLPDRCPPYELYKNITERMHALHSGVDVSAHDDNINHFNTTSGKLRHALKAGDIEGALVHWSSLAEKGLLHILGFAHMDSYSRLITALSPVFSPDASWHGARKEAAEKIALGAATVGGATGALSTCMLWNLRQNDPDAALELYRRYREELPDTPSKEKQDFGGSVPGEDTNRNPLDALWLSLPDKRVGYEPGRATVLLMVIAAHAMKESFVDALHTYVLETKIRIPQSALKENLSFLSSDPVLMNRVEEYVRRLDTSRLFARPASFKNHMDSLVNSHAIDRIVKHYKSLLEGLAEPGAYLVTSPSAVTHSKPIYIAEAVWGYFLTAFLRCRRMDLAEKLWDDMFTHKFTPGVVAWTALFDGYDGLGKVEDTLAGWKTMLSQGVKPNAFTYRALVSVLCTARRPDEALKSLKVFEDNVSKGSVSSDSSDNPLPLYNTLIHGLLTNSREEDATAVLQRMQKAGPKPDLVTYNTFLRYFGRKADFIGLGLTLRRLTSDGLVGDAFTFTTILSALLKAGREDAEQITFDLAKKQNITPSVGFYTAIIDHQVRLQDPQNLKSALDILRRMEQDREIDINVVPYTSILAGIYRTHWAEPAVAEECKEYIQYRMNSKKIRPNRVTYHILIAACLENREPEGLQNALSLYREMRKRRLALSNDTWYIILHGLIERGQWALANEMIDDLRRVGGVTLVGATLALVHRIRKRAARQMQAGPDAYL
jgi:pentatricopeptide repeat protein